MRRKIRRVTVAAQTRYGWTCRLLKSAMPDKTPKNTPDKRRPGEEKDKLIRNRYRAAHAAPIALLIFEFPTQRPVHLLLLMANGARQEAHHANRFCLCGGRRSSEPAASAASLQDSAPGHCSVPTSSGAPLILRHNARSRTNLAAAEPRQREARSTARETRGRRRRRGFATLSRVGSHVWLEQTIARNLRPQGRCRCILSWCSSPALPWACARRGIIEMPPRRSSARDWRLVSVLLVSLSERAANGRRMARVHSRSPAQPCACRRRVQSRRSAALRPVFAPSRGLIRAAAALAFDLRPQFHIMSTTRRRADVNSRRRQSVVAADAIWKGSHGGASPAALLGC